MQVFTLAPDLTVSMEWSWRMNEIWRKYYSDLWAGRPCADEQLCQEYNIWQQRLRESCQHIQRFFKLTGSLPVAGDMLQVLEKGLDSEYRDLSINTRTLLASGADDRIHVIYEVQSKHIEVLESWGGRMEKPAGWF